MIPCLLRRWFLAVRATSLNGENITKWGVTEEHAARRYMRAWTDYHDRQWAGRVELNR